MSAVDDERIFGPLTLRQFVYAAAGAAIAYLAVTRLGSPAGAVVAAFALGAAFALVRGAEPPPFDEAYVRRKRAELGREKFAAWARGKLALLASYETARAEKGLAPDPTSAAARALVERISAEG